MQKQLSRASFLKIVGLPESGPFELRPARHPSDGRWMIRVCANGCADVLVGSGQMAGYVDQIRGTAPDLAAQVDACLSELELRSSGQGG